MTDSHTHLNEAQFENNIPTFLNRFIEAGGKALLNVGHNPDSNLLTIAQARLYNNYPNLAFKSALGLHPELFNTTSHYPHKINGFDSLSKNLRNLQEQIETNDRLISAIGETGLDYFRLLEDHELPIETKETAIELQMTSFRKHVEMARNFKKPLTIHIRETAGARRAVLDAIKIICDEGGGEVTGSFHSFTGEMEDLKTILDLGFYVGFNGIITYKSAENVRALLKATPLERILLETDAPYLPPQSVRSNSTLSIKHGQPSDILEIAKVAAQLLSIPTEKLIDITSTNFYSLFGN